MTPARTFYHPQTGRIECAMSAGTDEQMSEVSYAYLLDGLRWIDADSDPDLQWVNGDVTDRPTLDLPTEHTIAAGVEWSVEGIPDGTTVTDTPGGLLGTVTGGLVREWALPGVYVMRLDPPFPIRPAECVVTVT